MSNKKELKEAYKQFKPDMGVYAYKCLPNGKVYIGYGQNIKGDMNSITFQLKLGSFFSNANSNLQSDWKKHGEQAFEITVLELLPYSKDETKSDYTEELKILREMCAEKFEQVEYIQK